MTFHSLVVDELREQALTLAVVLGSRRIWTGLPLVQRPRHHSKLISSYPREFKGQ